MTSNRAIVGKHETYCNGAECATNEGQERRAVEKLVNIRWADDAAIAKLADKIVQWELTHVDYRELPKPRPAIIQDINEAKTRAIAWLEANP